MKNIVVANLVKSMLEELVSRLEGKILLPSNGNVRLSVDYESNLT